MYQPTQIIWSFLNRAFFDRWASGFSYVLVNRSDFYSSSLLNFAGQILPKLENLALKPSSWRLITTPWSIYLLEPHILTSNFSCESVYCMAPWWMHSLKIPASIYSHGWLPWGIVPSWDYEKYRIFHHNITQEGLGENNLSWVYELGGLHLYSEFPWGFSL